ncbi:MAG: hypothetical protein EZS28_019554, partial [Streblomastix strix]
MPLEDLNNINISTIPLHNLKLRAGCNAILLRNMSIKRELMQDKFQETKFAASPTTCLPLTQFKYHYHEATGPPNSQERSLFGSVLAGRPGVIFIRELDQQQITTVIQSPFIQFAEKYFTPIKTSPQQKQQAYEKLCSYSKEQLTNPLIPITIETVDTIKQDNEASKYRLEYLRNEWKRMNHDLFRYFKETQSSTVSAHAKNFLITSIKNRELQDEAYCEVMKHVNKNEDENQSILGWRMLAFLCECFPPSEKLEPTFLNQIFITMRQQHEKRAQGSSATGCTVYNCYPATSEESIIWILCSLCLNKLRTVLCDSIALNPDVKIDEKRILPPDKLLEKLQTEPISIRNFGVSIDDMLNAQKLNILDKENLGQSVQSTGDISNINMDLAQSQYPSSLTQTQYPTTLTPSTPSKVKLFSDQVNPKKFQTKQRYLDQGLYINIADDAEGQAICLKLIKEWIKQLHRPLIPTSFIPSVEKILQGNLNWGERIAGQSDSLNEDQSNLQGKDAVAVAMQLCELISRCLINSHFYTLKYLVRFLRKLAFDKSESTMRKNLEQLVHHFSPLIIQYNEEGADDMRRM